MIPIREFENVQLAIYFTLYRYGLGDLALVSALSP
jgi:hypothetical protein